jgi:hypothetical protein
MLWIPICGVIRLHSRNTVLHGRVPTSAMQLIVDSRVHGCQGIAALVYKVEDKKDLNQNPLRKRQDDGEGYISRRAQVLHCLV